MINRKLTGVLAWGGLALILAVPSADLISAQMAGPSAAPAAAPVDAIKTAAVDGTTPLTVPVIKTAPMPIKGGKMPDYISDPDTTETSARTPVVETAPAQVAVVPPVPMPAHMRPLPPATTTPATEVAVVTPPSAEQPLILDENRVLANEAAIQPAPVVTSPPSSASAPRPPAMVGEEELQEWDSGSLADYLESRGLLSEASYSEQYAGEEDFDEDGFYLSDGPNNRRKVRPGEGDSFIVFPRD